MCRICACRCHATSDRAHAAICTPRIAPSPKLGGAALLDARGDLQFARSKSSITHTIVHHTVTNIHWVELLCWMPAGIYSLHAPEPACTHTTVQHTVTRHHWVELLCWMPAGIYSLHAPEPACTDARTHTTHDSILKLGDPDVCEVNKQAVY
jgi:hypothetical protein